jgi:DNA-directed RNA polymerase subunit N (RpoN/RPB10)
MEYLTCPTCGYFMGLKSLEFNKKKDNICNDSKLTEKEKSIKISKAIMDLKLRRYCCRMRMFTTVNLSTELSVAKKKIEEKTET